MIDYKISYAVGSGSYTVLETGVTTQTYTAISLASGETYKFKVQARNVIGYGDFSEELSILAA